MYPLYTYRNIDELRLIEKEHDIYPFIFEETKKRIESVPNSYIDITALTYNLQFNKGNIQPVYFNLSCMTDDTRIIIKYCIANDALEMFPLLFEKCQPMFEKDNSDNLENETIEYKNFQRKKIYKYNDTSDIEQIINYADANSIPIATFSQANGKSHDQFESFNKTETFSLLDLTSVAFAIEDNKNIIFLLEQFLESFPNINVISKTSQVDTLLKYFPLFFEGQEHITKILPELKDNITEDCSNDNEVTTITKLNDDSFRAFYNYFEHNLIGHKNFKNRFKETLKHFISLNRVSEQKVLSIFLYGASGIGKTEVARLIANGLNSGGYFTKINFQNYSSQDALNSLIGSPAGYVGCEHGELSDKIQKSKVGVILCDEFEKTTRPVFSFFLELLEEGHFTDSLAREYDVDGYIIIFTSNIQNEEEYKKTIPPELQTRFDLVCEFEVPTEKDKKDFLELLLEKSKEKFKEKFENLELNEDELKDLIDFDCSKLTALRDIKRIFNNKLMDLFDRKEK